MCSNDTVTAMKEKPTWITGFCILPCLHAFHKLSRDPELLTFLTLWGKAEGSISFRVKNMRLVVRRPGLKPWCCPSNPVAGCLFPWFCKLVIISGANSQFTGPLILGTRDRERAHQTRPVVPTEWVLQHYHRRIFKKCKCRGPTPGLYSQEALAWEASPPGSPKVRYAVWEPLDWTKASFKKFMVVPNAG